MPLGQLDPNFYLQAQRYNNSPGTGFFGYDPYMAQANPFMGPELQQEYLRQMFNLQNPRQALPNNMGLALGNLAQQAFSKFQQGQNSGDPQQQQQQQQGPMQLNPQQKLQQIHQQILTKTQAYAQQGMAPAEAFYTAGTDMLLNSGNLDPVIQQEGQRAMEQAKTMGYNPEQAITRSYTIENFRRPTDNAIVGLRTGSPEWRVATQQNWPKAGDVSGFKPGESRQLFINGRYTTEYADTNGQFPEHTKSDTSSAPAQYINQTTGPPDVMGPAGLAPQISTAAAADKQKQELASREENTKNFTDQVNKILSTVRNSNGGAVGKPGDIYEHANEWIMTAKTLAGQFNQQDLLDPRTYNFAGLDEVVGKLRGSAISATTYHSQMLSAAYLMTALQSNEGDMGRISKQRVQDNLEQLAEHSSDPQAIINTLQSAVDTAVNNLRTKSDVLYGRGSGAAHLQFFGLKYPVHVQSNDDWNDLPHGQVYVGPDGNRRTKN
jgi:hypothetical protein